MRTGFKLLLALIVSEFHTPAVSAGEKKDPLRFPADRYTVETKVVRTSTGEKKVTYHSFLHLPYVANPVDKDYQSLNVLVPVMVDDKVTDSRDAPILFVIGVGGYMSVNNAQSLPGGAGGTGISASLSNRSDLALAEGFTLVIPGCRGRDNKAADGTFYGKAPAAIADLKAAVRYIRHNRGLLPGNSDRIISVGCSAGGALSALLGASGNSPLFDKYLQEIGAADAKDDIFASACFSPITDLEHADMAYEWNFGSIPARSGPVNQELSQQLRSLFAAYQSSLKLQGKNGFGVLTAENYPGYLLQYYLYPTANRKLGSLSEDKRRKYLTDNPWITWTTEGPAFTFSDYVKHVGRMKGLPAFDDFNKKQPEPLLFGNKTTDARHFTTFSLRYSTGDQQAEIDSDLQTVVNLMNALYFLKPENKGCASHWWLRNGTSDNHTSQTVMVNLATRLENLGKKVNAGLFWDGGHCADDDPEGFVEWMKKIGGN